MFPAKTYNIHFNRIVLFVKATSADGMFFSRNIMLYVENNPGAKGKSIQAYIANQCILVMAILVIDLAFNK